MTAPARILVVDDEPAICHNCQKILAKDHHEVAYAYNGHDALSLMTQAPFDVVVTDLKMSRMGGMEVLARVRAISPETMVVVITGYSTVSSAVEVMKLGAFDYLPKPFTPAELRAVVAQALKARDVLLQNRQLADPEPRISKPVHQLVGQSPKMKQVIEMIAKVAPTDATVLVYGESGTGKELVARAVHANSKRADKVFFAVDCGTLSGSLLESELFGHARGAFTGAHKAKEGIFLRADGGTVFLDEIGNIDLEVQGKLLRFLESRDFLPVGETATRKVDIRLILATNRNLEEMVAAGRFRHDFYYRIYVYPIFLPALRERPEDILPIAYHFIAHYAGQMGKPVTALSDEAVRRIMGYDWPGNVRQLRNVIERAVIQSDTERISARDIWLGQAEEAFELLEQVPDTNEALKRIKKDIRQKATMEIEKKFILQALVRCDWNVTRAARAVGLKRTNFQNMMRKYGVVRPPARQS
jgi:DNA-binding NtrC family response regulator